MESHFNGLKYGKRSRVDPRQMSKLAARYKDSAKISRVLLLAVMVLLVMESSWLLLAFNAVKPKGSTLMVQERDIKSNIFDHVNGTDGDEHFIYPPVDCQKKILILADVRETKAWISLDSSRPPWNILTRHPDDDNLYQGLYECRTKRYLEGQKNNCTIQITFSSNTEQMPGKDAVIFNVVPPTLHKNIDKLLLNKNSDKNQSIDQLWLMYTLESPHMNYKTSKGTFAKFPVHGLMSYTLDSTIAMAYGSYQPGLSSANSSKHGKELDRVMSGESKTRLVAWMASNCRGAYWPRMEFIEELQRYIAIDTYGGCGKLKCRRGSNRIDWTKQCDQLMRSYKFYLSIENAECEEYITEKLWKNALQRGVVPIVYGAPRASYEKLAPPNSFIYAGDFNSVKSLADHIIELDKRPELYSKFFEWRNQGSLIKRVWLSPNKLCDVLPVIEQLRRGKLKKKPISTYPWFETCRINPFKYNYTHFPSFQDWKPW